MPNPIPTVNPMDSGSSFSNTVADDPFYISPNETTSVMLVTDVLAGTKNFSSWKKSMELSLSGRSKLGFVRAKGIAGGILHAKDAANAWKTLNKRYKASHKERTFALRKEIYRLMQGEMAVSTFLEKLINLSDELDALLAEDVDYQMSNKAKEEEHVMSFLMGLSEKHSQIRTQILAMRDFTSLDGAYNMVAQDELQKN